MSPYDRALFRRALLALSVLASIAFAIVSATDEATSTLGMRLARLSALSPLLTASAVLGLAAHARSRGELRALEALGAPPWRILRGAELAGVAVAVLGVVVLMAPFTDATSLLPAVERVTSWTLLPDGSRATAEGLTVHADGAIEVMRAALPHALPRAAAWAALPCVAPVLCVVPSWASTPMSLSWRASSGIATSLLAVVLLHLVAAGRIPAWAAVVAALPVSFALWRARR